MEIVKHECINHISKCMYRGLEKVVKDAKSAAGCGLGGKGKLTQVRMKKWWQSTSTACRRRMTCSMTIVMSIGAGRSKRWPLVLTLIRGNKELSTFAESYSPWPSSRKTTSEACSSSCQRELQRPAFATYFNTYGSLGLKVSCGRRLLCMYCPSSNISANQIFWNAACRSAHQMQTNLSTLLSGRGLQRPSSLPGAPWSLWLHSA